MERVLKPLTEVAKQLLEQQTADYERQLLESEEARPARDWLRSRGMDGDDARHFRLGFVANPHGDEHRQFLGRVSIPNICARGHVVGLKYRAVLDDDDGPKFMALKGASVRTYNLQALSEAMDRIWVAEGESDCWILNKLGYPAIAVPGANHWKPYRNRILAGFDEVVLVRDNDEAGEKLVQAMESVEGLAVKTPPDPHKDVSEFYLADGPEAVQEWLGLP